jgi:3-methylfumaryl-CoA hydratase
MTASAWRSIYESQEQVIITRTGTHIRKPATGRFAGLASGVSVPGILVAIQRYANVAGLDIAHLQEWAGKSESRSDQVTAAPIAALAATLDIEIPYPEIGDALPPLWHWLYFLPFPKQSELGSDGHAKRGGFLPPVELPRRMWAGGRVEFYRPLRVGELVTRTSRIVDVKFREGRSSGLVFVLVRHAIGNALTEEHDIVYRDHPRPGGASPAPQIAPEDAEWEREVSPDDVLLFRYSALTFNGHRIHYDRRYALEVEGYPGLVVHGPLIATLLLDLVRSNLPAAVITRFDFRAVSPIFDTGTFSVCGKRGDDGRTIRLWAKNPAGALAMTATASTGAFSSGRSSASEP